MSAHVRRHRTRTIVVMAVVAATGGFLYGFDTAVIAGAMLQIKTQWGLSSLQEGLLTSSILFGGMLGSLIGGGMADRFGRRSIMMGTAATFVVGSFWCGLAKSLLFLGVGRFLLGVAVGVVSVAVPLYIAEIAPSRIRGALVSAQQLFLVGGVVVSYLVNAHWAATPDGWRLMFMVGALPGVLLGVGMLFMPESPRWLIGLGRKGSARRMLRRLGADDADAEIERMQSGLSQDDTGGASWSELRATWLRPALIIGVVITILQQMSGIDAVIFYSPTIFSLAGYDPSSSAIVLTIGVGIINFVMTVAAMGLVDRLGRRLLISGGYVLVIGTLGALGLAMGSVAQQPLLRPVIVGAVFLFTAAFSLSLGAVPGAMTAEIYPQRVRGLAFSVVLVVSWMFSILVSATFPILVEVVGAATTFMGFAAIGVAGLVFCIFYLPETKGKTLEEIEAFWQSGQPPWKLR